MSKDYFRYEITNGVFRCFSGADTIEEARNIVKETLKDDKAIGFNTSRENYHIFRLNQETGERIKEVF